MNLLSFRSLVALAIAVSGGLGVFAACSTNSSVPADGVGGSASSSGSGSDDSSSSPSTDSTVSNTSGATDGGSGGMTLDALITYDGPPPNVDGSQVACATPNGLPIKFNPVYSGFDGVHTYQVPVFVVGADPATVTWSSSDPSMVELQPYVRGIMITTKKAGDVTIIATVGAMCGSAPLHITAYTVAEWNIGNARYNNTVPLMINPEAGLPDGAPFDGSFDGAPPFDAAPDAAALCAMMTGMRISDPFAGTAPACTNCHGVGSNGMLFGMTLFSDVGHTPEQTGGFSEDELTNAFVNGTIPDGGVFDPSITPYCIWHLIHLWRDIDTPEKQAGMRAYLRSLTPQEQTGCFELFNTKMCADGG